jgi:hypothetical protein
LETKSLFICDRRIAREAARSAKRTPPATTAVSRQESARLMAKLRRAQPAGV